MLDKHNGLLLSLYFFCTFQPGGSIYVSFIIWVIFKAYCDDVVFSVNTWVGHAQPRMEQHTLENVNNCLNSNIYSYLRHLVVEVLI